MNVVIDEVARHLGNTRSVCRQCYIHPGVMESWRKGRLAEELAGGEAPAPQAAGGLDDEEALVLRWLEAREG